MQAGRGAEGRPLKQGGGQLRLSVFYDHIAQTHEQTGKAVGEILDTVRKSGIEAVDIRLGHIQEAPDLPGMLEGAGLSVSCIYEFYDMGYSDEGGKVLRHLEKAQELASGSIMIVPGFLRGEDVGRMKALMKDRAALFSFLESSDAAKRMRDGMERAGAQGGEMGVQVLFEDFDDFASPMSGINGVSWFLGGTEKVGLTFDCGNFIMYGEDVLAAFDLFRPRIRHVHCKDRGKGAVAVGQGSIPIKELVAALNRDGYPGYFVIEHFDADRQLECIQESARYLLACGDGPAHAP